MSHIPSRLPPLVNPYAIVERPARPLPLVAATGIFGVVAGFWLSGAAQAVADPASDPSDAVEEDSFGGHTPNFEVPDSPVVPEPPAAQRLDVSIPSVPPDLSMPPTPTDSSLRVHEDGTLTPFTVTDLDGVPDFGSVDQPQFGVTELTGQPDPPALPTDFTAQPRTSTSDPISSRAIDSTTPQAGSIDQSGTTPLDRRADQDFAGESDSTERLSDRPTPPRTSAWTGTFGVEPHELTDTSTASTRPDHDFGASGLVLRSSDPDETAAELTQQTSPSIAGMVHHLRGTGSSQVSELRDQRWTYDTPEDGWAAPDDKFYSIVTDVGRRLRQLSLDNPGLPSELQQNAPGHLFSPSIGCYVICEEDRENGRFEVRVADPIIVGNPVGSADAIPYFLPDGRCRIQFVCTKEFDGTPNAGLQPADLALAAQLQSELDAGRYFARFGWTNFDLLSGTGVDAQFNPFTGQWNPDIAVLPGGPLVTDRINGPDGPAATEAAGFSWPLPLDVAPFGSSSVIFGDGRHIDLPWPDESTAAAEDAARLAEFDQRLRGGAATPPNAPSDQLEALDPPLPTGWAAADDDGREGYTPGWLSGVERELEAFDHQLQQRMSHPPDPSSLTEAARANTEAATPLADSADAAALAPLPRNSPDPDVGQNGAEHERPAAVEPDPETTDGPAGGTEGGVVIRPDLQPRPDLESNAGQLRPPVEPASDIGADRDDRWDPPVLEGFDLESGPDVSEIPGGNERTEDLELPVTSFPLPLEESQSNTSTAPDRGGPAGVEPSPALVSNPVTVRRPGSGERAAQVPALRPGSGYPLCGGTTSSGCIDPPSLRDENYDGVADNAGRPVVGEGRVGPAIVGPRIVGPAIVGEGRVGPAIVGPRIVGPAIVGEGRVGPGPVRQTMDFLNDNVVQPVAGALSEADRRGREQLRTTVSSSQPMDGFMGVSGVTRHRVWFMDGGQGVYDPQGRLVTTESGNPPSQVNSTSLYLRGVGGSAPMVPGNPAAPAVPRMAPRLAPI